MYVATAWPRVSRALANATDASSSRDDETDAYASSGGARTGTSRETTTQEGQVDDDFDFGSINQRHVATTHGALTHREARIIARYAGRVVEFRDAGARGATLGRVETDRGEEAVDATWREASAKTDADERRRSRKNTTRAGGDGTSNGGGREEEIEVTAAFATVSVHGEVFVCSARATRRGEETRRGECELERAIRLDDGERATCCASDEEEIVVGTDRGRVIFLTWSRGVEGRSVGLGRSERNDGGAASVDWCADTETLVVRFESGSTCAATIDGRGNVLKTNWFEATPTPATCAAFHRGTRALALGDAEGDVRVYEDASTSSSSEPKIVFSLKPWGVNAKDTGAAAYASWSHDGRALAVGYRRQGLSVWSDSGCLTMCSLHHGFGGDSTTTTTRIENVFDGAAMNTTSSTMDDTSIASSDAPMIGACLGAPAWGCGGYSLHVPTRTSAGARLLEYSLVRNTGRAHCEAADAYNGGAFDNESCVLLGDDRIFLLAAASASRKMRLRQVVCPREYLSTRWPLRIASASPNGEIVAVAGTRGCLMYDALSERWLMMQNESDENAMETVDFAWLRPQGSSAAAPPILVACASSSKSRMFTSGLKTSYGMHLFASERFQHLGWYPLSAEPVCARALGAHLVVAFANGEIALFTSAFEPDGTLAVSPVRESNGQRRKTTLSLDGDEIVGVSLLCPQGSVVEQDASEVRECVALTARGDAFIVDLSREFEPVVAMRGVSEFWVSFENSEEATSSSSSSVNDQTRIFAYGAEGMRVAYVPKSGARLILRDGASSLTIDGADKHPELEFDRELYPVAVSSRLNRIVGVAQKLSLSESGESPFFSIAPRMHSVVPYTLRKLLSAGRADAALAYARAARVQTPHFTHALEWLLFTALESSGADAHSQEMLKDSIALLSKLPNFLDVVVSVARKTDSAQWKSLFKYAGTPSELSLRALKHDRLRIAACYILVVDKLEDEAVGKEVAVQIMQKALRARDYNLVEDLIKFLLKPISETPLGKRKPGILKRVLQVVVPPPNSVLALGERGDEELVLDEPEQLILKTHLDELADGKELVAMGAFIAITSFDGVGYLTHESDREGSAYISDFAEALEQGAKHVLDGDAFDREIKRESHLINAGSVDFDERGDTAHLTHLMDAARHAECTDWTLLCATLLGRLDVLKEIFETQRELREPWVKICRQLRETSSHSNLVRHLSQVVAGVEKFEFH